MHISRLGRALLHGSCASILSLGLVAASHAGDAGDAQQKLAKLFELGGDAQDFLKRAKAADQIADPLARCLAFPDFPGNQWPAGLAKAHCELLFGHHIRASQIQEAIAGNSLAELERLFAADLAGHFSAHDEAIHRDFDAFDGEQESETISKAWLLKAPTSPYALTARGQHLMRKALEARGGAAAADVPDADWAVTRGFATEATALFQQALKAEPRLLPAHIGLVRLGMLAQSVAGDPLAAAKAGQAVDAGCALLNQQIMWSLSPRWGGSYEQMQALADLLQAEIGERPLLALSTVMPAADAAEMLRFEKPAEASLIAGPLLLASTRPEAFETMSAAVAKSRERKPFEAIVYSVAASRFKAGSAWTARQRGALLHQEVKDPRWALSALEFAVREEPTSGAGHLLLGEAYLSLGRAPEAEREFKLAMEDNASRAAAMRSLSRVLTIGAADKQVVNWIPPAEAIRLATASAPAGVPGVFVLDVLATGAQDRVLFLNSDLDYRDPKNLTVAISPGVAEKLRESLDADPLIALKGKTVQVTGVVRRVPISVRRPGMPESFYYQTHVEVTDLAQLQVLEPGRTWTRL